MNFINNSAQEVVLNVDKTVLILVPSQEISLEMDLIEDISISIQCNKNSYIESGRFKPTTYHLVVKTEYYFSGISKDEIFIVTCEEIQADSNNDCGVVIYEKAFLISEANQPRSMHHHVLSEDTIKKSYYHDFKKSRNFELFIGPAILSGIDMIVICAFVSIFKGIYVGLKIGGISFIVIYLLHIVGEWIAGVFWRKITKQDYLSEFEKCFTNNFMHDVFKK